MFSFPASLGAKPWGHTGKEQEGSLDSESVLGQLLDAGLAPCEPPSACMEIRPWTWLCSSAFLALPTQPFLGVWRGTSAVFHNPVSPVTQGLRRLVSCSVFPRAFVLPLGGPLSLSSVRLNSLVVILIISVWGCFQLPPDLQKAKNRKLFFFLFWNTFSVKG